MIKPNFTQAGIERYMNQQAKRMNDSIIARLQYIGETFINNARSKNTYTDQTGNLRSSIGYIILKDGVKRGGSTFEKVKDGDDGSIAGKKLIKELRAQYPQGYVLICVAGMEYAAAVESKGKDVLTGSSLIAEKELRKAFKQYKG